MDNGVTFRLGMMPTERLVEALNVLKPGNCFLTKLYLLEVGDRRITGRALFADGNELPFLLSFGRTQMSGTLYFNREHYRVSAS